MPLQSILNWRSNPETHLLMSKKMLDTAHSETRLCPLKNNPDHRLSVYTASGCNHFKMSTPFISLPLDDKFTERKQNTSELRPASDLQPALWREITPKGRVIPLEVPGRTDCCDCGVQTPAAGGWAPTAG